MAEQQSSSSSRSTKDLGHVVSQVTVKALREFDTGDMPTDEPEDMAAVEETSEGTPSVKSGSRPASDRPPSSKKGSRPPSVAGTPPSRPATGGGSHRASPVAGTPASRPPTGGGSQRASPVAERAPSAARDRPPSVRSPAAGRPPSSTSDKKQERSRPASMRKDEVQASADDEPDILVVRPPSASEQPTSDRPPSGRPGSDRPSSGRSASNRPSDGERVRSGRPSDGGSRGDPRGSGSHGRSDPAQPVDNRVLDPQTTVIGRMPDDPSDGGDSDDEYEGVYEDEDIDSADEDEDDSDTEMTVLDPNHPLLQRFQKALKAHLEKQDEKVTLELRELQEAVKNRRKEREDLGVELYGVQQELARHQMMLETNHDEFANLKQDRNQMELKLLEVRDMYRNKMSSVTGERKKGAELQQEVENLALRLFYMENAKEDVRSDIAVMRRVAEKAETEVSKSESDKQRQDLFVDRLVERMDKLREEIAMFETQILAQNSETKLTKEALTEAHIEIEAINLEKKQLFQQWNSSLIGMRRRDEAHSAMNEALREQQQQIMSIETEIDGYKKNIQKEQEQNEKLTLVLNKTEVDIATVRKMFTQCQAKHDALKNEYATYTRMLHETEQALNRANTDKTLRLNEVNALRKQIEREYLEKVKLEDETLEKIRSQLTMDKSSKYTSKLTKKCRDRTKDLEAQVATVENQISKDTLEVSNTRTRVERLHKIFTDLDEDIKQNNDIISRSDAEIVKRNAVIERKQGILDQYNKRLEHMIQSAGGVELGPLEIQINSLQKSIDAELQEIAELQQMWLRDQSELVSLSKEKDTQCTDVENLKKQLTILSQKKLRIEGEIGVQQTEISDVERSIKHMQNDMLKLNMLLHKERGMELDLNQGNSLLESDFIGSLKEAEYESIDLQGKIDALKEEKERLLNSLVEAERQIMLWEKKSQLARETKAAVDSEMGQGEIRAMETELHRMQVRYTQLMKTQERMIQDMEKAVSRRDTIVTRGDAQSKMNKKVLTQGTFQRQIAETKKKIKSTIQDANKCDDDIHELRHNQQEISQQLEERQLNVQQLQSSADTLDGDIERLIEYKHKNLFELLGRQQRTKYYQQTKDGKYTRLCKTETSLDTEHQKQVDRLHTLNAIVERLNQEFPHVQPALRRPAIALASRIQPDDM